MNIPFESFLAIAKETCALSANASDWIVESDLYPGDPWIRVTNLNAVPTKQGWKIHVSAMHESATSVLERAFSVLLPETASFKLACSIDSLMLLNEGEFGLSQIGKFITIYPNSESHAIRLAVELDRVTRGLRGIRVPSDRQLSHGSLVHYRYGVFDDSFIQTPLGEIVPVITKTDGRIEIDRRGLSYEPPKWIPDPFEAAGVAQPMLNPARLIANHYLIVSKFYDGAHGTVYHAVDINAPKPCILKRAIQEIGVDSTGDGAQRRLRNEAAVLARLAPDDRFPIPFELVAHDGDLYLAEQKFEGATLEQHMRALASYGKTPGTEQVIAWGTELAQMLSKLHASGLVHHDLKSANVIIGIDGRLRLVDFDGAQSIGCSELLASRGTPGYACPQQQAGCAPAITDDLYSLGALLYFMSTSAEPSLATADVMLGKRSAKMLNPALNGDLEAVISRCLQPEPEDRYASAVQVENALRRIDVKDSARRVRVAGGNCASLPRLDTQRYEGLARRLGDSLSRNAQASPDNLGLGWRSTHDGDALWAHDLAIGSAGALLALAELVMRFGDDHHGNVLKKAAAWLASVPPFADPPLPGLYIGESGVGAALLRSGQVLGDVALVNAAIRKSCSISEMPYSSPDVYNGTAGRLRFHLMTWDATGDPTHLGAAVRAGDVLLQHATVRGDDAYWIIPPGYESLSGTANLGYAHGAAGIADCLLDLFEATGELRFLEIARRANHWLAGLAVPALDDGKGLTWPIDQEGALFGPFWCHGATGVGRFFLHAAQVGLGRECWELAKRAALTVSQGGRWVGPTQCHGLAGNIEFLIDMFQATGDPVHLSDASDLASALEAFSLENGDGLLWQSETPSVITPDYLVGYAGVAMCLLRLGQPETMPHQLSRRGFQWQGHRH